MFVKIVVCFCLGFFVSCYANDSEDYPDTSCGRTASHDTYFGNRINGDKLVFESNPRNEGSFLRKKSEDVIYPAYSSVAPLGPITRIELIDQNDDGYGGCAYLSSGGVTNNNVVIHVKSGLRGYGYNFIVKIYALPPTK